jgi:hypothetical protein
MAAAASAQVSSLDVIVAEKATSRTAGLTLVNPTTQKSRPVQGITTGPFTLVALNSLDVADVWGSSLRPTAGRMPPLDHWIMSGDALSKPGSGHGIVDIGLFGALKHVHCFRNDLLFTLSGSRGGVYLRPRTGGSSKALTNANCNHIAVLGDKIYTSTTDSPNVIIEVDMTTATPKVRTLKLVLDPKAPTGSKLPTTINAMCANGPEAGADSLAVFDDKGVLYVVKPAAPATTHNVTTNNKPGIAAPVGAVYHPKVPLNLVVATSTGLYDALQYILAAGKPFYTSTATITDIAYDAGGVAFYGKGCQGSNARTPEMVFAGLPYQGNTSFAIRMRNGNPSSLARLVIGFSKTSWNTNKLPLDLGFMGAGGCNLLASIDVMLTVGTDAKGEINIVNKVPVDSKLVGVTVYTQFAVADKVNPAGLVTSNAMQLVIR